MKWDDFKNWENFRESAGKLAVIPYAIGHSALLIKMVQENTSDIATPTTGDTVIDALAFGLFAWSLYQLNKGGKTSKGVFKAMSGAAVGKAAIIGKQFVNGGIAGASASIPEFISTCWVTYNAYKEKQKHKKQEQEAKNDVIISQFKENKETILQKYPYALPMALSAGLKVVAIAGLYSDMVSGRAGPTTSLYIAMFSSWTVGSALIGVSKQKALPTPKKNALEPK